MRNKSTQGSGYEIENDRVDMGAWVSQVIPTPLPWSVIIDATPITRRDPIKIVPTPEYQTEKSELVRSTSSVGR